MWLKVAKVWMLLAVIFILAVNSHPADEFYYGGFHAHGVFDLCPDLRDSLKFNLVFLMNLGSNNIHYLADNSLKAVAEQYDQNSSPTMWSVQSFYTMWEAEGFPESRKGFSYNGGAQICDPEAHPYPCSDPSWNAMRFDDPPDSGVVQTGPDYRQYSLGPNPYLVDFNLKFSGNRSISTKQVCKIMVEADGSTIRESTLVVGDFPAGGYKEFRLQYTLPDFRYTQFKIYWHGVDTLFIDHVEVGNSNGYELMSGDHDQDIFEYVQQSWVDTSVVYRWYMRDQPGSIDCYMPYAHIDSLLKNNLPNIPGAQFYCNFSDTSEVHEYLLRSDPVEYMIDLYPFRAHDSPSNYQTCINGLTKRLSEGKIKAESVSKDLWVAIQAHIAGDAKASCDPGEIEYLYPPDSTGTIYCCTYRDPTEHEIRLQTFLAMCYGADAVMNYRIPYHWDSSHLETGLYDQFGDSATYKWEEIKDFSGPRVKQLGSIVRDLNWQGAGVCYEVASIPGSFVHSLKSAEFDSAWIEVGFFKDSVDTDYFMLVNRRCLSTEEQNVTVYIDSAEIGNKKMWYVIDQYSQDTTFTGAIDGIIPFTAHLEPGEGKLFKLVGFPDSAFHGTAHPFTWQGGIMVDGDVTVDSGQTLVILPPAEIVFYANTDVVQVPGYDPTDADFIVNGGLRAVGTETDSIMFTSTEGNPNDWEWIEVSDSASSNVVLSYCVVEYAYTGIESKSPSPDTITHSSFRNNWEYGIHWQNDSEGMISHNQVSYDTASPMGSHGLKLFRIRNGMSSSLVTANVITNYWRGLWVQDCSTRVLSNTISNASNFAVCVGEEWYTSFPSYVTLDNISVTGELGYCGFWAYWNSGYVGLDHCKLLPSAGCGPPYGVAFDNDLVDSVYFMRHCEIKNFTVCGVFSNFTTTLLDLGTIDDKGYNKIHSNVDTAWYVYTAKGIGRYSSTVYAQYNWWGEYPPDPSRFYGNVIFMPADSVEWEDPDSLQLKQTVSGQVPKRFELVQNYPNPFNPATSIQFTVGSLQSPSHITLKIYNILGQAVRTLVDEEKAEGSYTLYWDGRNQNGKEVSSGIYFYKLEAGNFTDVKKMVLLR